MKEFRRLTAFVLTLVLLSTAFVFADTPAQPETADPTATIISPLSNSVINSDSFLVSVKINKALKIKVGIYEEKIAESRIVTSVESGVVTTSEAVTYKSVDVTTFEAIDFTSNPALETYKDIKVMEPLEYTCKQQVIDFYITKAENLTPGLYKVVIETLDAEDKVVETTSSLICVKGKPQATEVVFETEKTSVLTAVTNFLKSLFK